MCMYVHVCTRMCSVASVVSDSLLPHGLEPPGFSVHEILQSRILEWVAMPSSRGSSWHWDRTSSCITGRLFIAEPLRKPMCVCVYIHGYWIYISTYVCVYSVYIYIYTHTHNVLGVHCKGYVGIGILQLYIIVIGVFVISLIWIICTLKYLTEVVFAA